MAELDPKLTAEAEEVLGEIEDDMVSDGKSADFVADMRERFEKYGSRTFVSDKQLSWLKTIRDNQ